MGTVKLRKPPFRKRLFVSKSAYYMNRSQQDAERDLHRLVHTAEREYAWVFFPKTSTWVFYD